MHEMKNLVTKYDHVIKKEPHMNYKLGYFYSDWGNCMCPLNEDMQNIYS